MSGPYDDYFGVCPACGYTDGYINIGRGHWFYCVVHKVRWFVGSNLFSDWRHETEADQKRRYDELGFHEFTEREPAKPIVADLPPQAGDAS